MVTIEPVLNIDDPRLLDFLDHFEEEDLGRAYWQARIDHWWRRNPWFEEGKPAGWILVDEDRIVGFLGSIPYEIQIAGKRFLARSATTWRVEKEYRVHSEKLLFAALDACRETALFDTTPTAVVEAMLQAFRFLHLPHPDRLTYVYTNRFDHFIESCQPRPLLRKFLRLLGRLACRCAFRSKRSKDDSVEVREILEPGGELDTLWEKTRSQHPHTRVRSRVALEWYAFGPPPFRKRLFGAYREGVLRGYALFLEKGRWFRCLDFWIDSDSREVIGPLLDEATRWAVCRQFVRIEVPHYHPEVARHEWNTPGHEVLENRWPAYLKSSPALIKEMKEGGSYFVWGEGDIGC
ncbi:MAG: hypothetical protein QF752_17245 [Planctomycetota bacterium]|jgi:hypothetical protein|nr:hypothetical protein [Planctomycetota bacterium]